MSRVKQLLFGSVLAVALSAPLTSLAVAAPASSQPPPTTNIEDVYYDFEVYMAAEVTIYCVTYQFRTGKPLQDCFLTLAQAETAETHLWNNGAIWVQISVSQIPGPWQYVITFDKRADAEGFADVIDGTGFYAKVERVYAWAPLYQLTR